jgi:hypothetical protein
MAVASKDGVHESDAWSNGGDNRPQNPGQSSNIERWVSQLAASRPDTPGLLMDNGRLQPIKKGSTDERNTPGQSAE